ncbi:MAG: hypothetical protein ACRD2Z_09725 [Thermoanaerobaculia bacterium]
MTEFNDWLARATSEADRNSAILRDSAECQEALVLFSSAIAVLVTTFLDAGMERDQAFGFIGGALLSGTDLVAREHEARGG